MIVGVKYGPYYNSYNYSFVNCYKFIIGVIISWDIIFHIIVWKFLIHHSSKFLASWLNNNVINNPNKLIFIVTSLLLAVTLIFFSFLRIIIPKILIHFSLLTTSKRNFLFCWYGFKVFIFQKFCCIFHELSWISLNSIPILFGYSPNNAQ